MADGNSRDVTVQLPATAGAVDTTGMPSTGSLPGGSDTGPLAPGQTFGPRYHIIRLLGIGGMGAVYHAWDTELNVSVAIKVIRPEIMANPTAGADVERRFKRELVLARQVTHKNVVRIHDLGEIQQIKYITMSYVNGVDLASRIKDAGRLPVADVMPLARAIVSGLVAAHGAGVVHRDLKPANIMIGVNGDTLIMDFGIARSSGGAVEAAATAAVTATLPAHLQSAAAAATVAAIRATTTASSGTTIAASNTSAATSTAAEGIVGTVQYMAPEQASGLAVDQRADIYAFGLILYDVLAGLVRLSSPDGPVAELRGRMKQAPPPLRTLVPDVPEALEKLVARCLDPAAEKRFQTTVELEAELERFGDDGELIPVKRLVSTWTLAAVVVLAVAAVGGGWWYARSLIPPPPHDPVSVVIADFTNLTGDASFDRTLEPMLRRALQGASFISAYDRSAIISTLGVRPPDKLDENAARELAVKQGVGMVLSGTVDRQGGGYAVSMKATQTVTGMVVADSKGRASDRNDVVATATRLVAGVRKALGDEVSESAQIFAMTNLSATSLDVVKLYAASQEAASTGKFEDAKRDALAAVAVDPKFGVGYQMAAVASRNLGSVQDAEKYINQALQYLDTMTPREKYTTRGFYYRMTSDWQACVKEYGELVTRYAADPVGHNQRALCQTKLRNMKGAVTEMQQVVKMLPNRGIFRANLALYANYASDFETGEKEARAILDPNAYFTIPLAQAQSGKGQLTEAAETYRKMAAIDELGPSLSASGLGDLALYEGRFSDAARIFEQGADADLAAKKADKAAMKLVSLAYAHVLRGLPGPAVTAAEKALEQNSKAVPIRFLAARVFVEAGSIEKARALAEGLADELPVEPQAYAKIIEGDIALKNGKARVAIKALTAANELLDTWIGDFDLGRAYLEAGLPTQADSQFDRCLKRKGEALSLFADEEPTFGYFPPVYYYQGLVREALKNAGFAESYRAYLAIRGASTEDPLLPEVRRRAGL
jgi:eukaryotic-like serine/threonine-protein kinase